MYRMSGDSSNVMSHPIRHAYGPQQLTLDSSIAVEDQCMRDDLYFNLMYKSFDSNAHGITHRINQLANTENANLRPISTELERNDKAWRSSLLDYRQMDSELARIQRDYEAIENNLSRFRKDKRCSPEFKLIGTALLTDHSMAREHFDRSEHFPFTSTLSTDLSAWSLHSGTLTEIPSSYQLPSITDLLAARNNHTAVAATVAATPPPPPPPPPPPSKPERCQRESVKVEQPVQSQKESNEVRGSEPYYKCPVCWNCVRQRKPVSTTCGHVFCGSCIKAALRTTCKCPVCQRLMTTRQIFRIYL